MHEKIIQVQKWTRSHPPGESEIEQILRAEGLSPSRWSNSPGKVYEIHNHPYHKVIVVVEGSITFGFVVKGEPTTLYPGDRLDLPANVAHNAVVGSEGVVCLEAHKFPE